MKDFALTTIDNPFDPFKQFDEWMKFDEDKKYFTCAYLARIANTSNELSEEANEEEISSAMDEIVSFHPKFYVKLEEGKKYSFPLEQSAIEA